MPNSQHQFAGYRRFLGWTRTFGRIDAAGIEGTRAYGAGLARHLATEGVTVFEVPRPDRRLRRNVGKSDPIDAEAAARAVLAGTARVVPKLADGPIEAVRALRVARMGAIKAKTAATNTLRSMIITAPDALRAQLPSTGLPNKVIDACLRLRPDPAQLHDPTQATKAALRTIAARAKGLREEIQVLNRQLERLVADVAPGTRATFAMGSTPPAPCWSPLETTPIGFARRLRSLVCAAWRPYQRRRARQTVVTDYTGVATVRPIGPCTSLSSFACATASAPALMSPVGQPRDCRSRRSSAA
jgi:hypothetical protein